LNLRSTKVSARRVPTLPPRLGELLHAAFVHTHTPRVRHPGNASVQTDPTSPDIHSWTMAAVRRPTPARPTFPLSTGGSFLMVVTAWPAPLGEPLLGCPPGWPARSGVWVTDCPWISLSSTASLTCSSLQPDPGVLTVPFPGDTCSPQSPTTS
jgi:hypothetical protein